MRRASVRKHKVRGRGVERIQGSMNCVRGVRIQLRKAKSTFETSRPLNYNDFTRQGVLNPQAQELNETKGLCTPSVDSSAADALLSLSPQYALVARAAQVSRTFRSFRIVCDDSIVFECFFSNGVDRMKFK